MTEKKHKSLSLTTAHNGLIIQIRRIVLEHGKGRRRCRVAATIKDIAAAAGVSRGTVDRVLHGRGGVCPEVREKVLQLAEELEYRPNRAALGLAALKKPVRIGLLLPSEGNPFFGEVIRGAKAAEKSLSDYGTALLPEPVRGYDTAGHLRALQSLEERGADGVCAATVDVPEVRAAISALAERGVPVIALNSELSPCGCLSYVGCDYRQTGRIAAGLLLLLGLGAPRLLIVTGSRRVRGHNERVSGFLERLREAGKPFSVLEEIECEDDDEAAYALTLEALRRLPQADCLYVAGAGVQGVGRAVREAGLLGKAPILAFDDTPAVRALVHEGAVPATVCQSPFEQGYRAVKLMFRYLTSRSEPPKRWIAKPVIKIRENIDEGDGFR